MGPAPELLDRRLLFFTGKGGVGKSTMAAATALLAAEQRQARPARRGRRQGRHPRAVRARAGRLQAPRGPPGRARDGDGHRGVAARVPQGSTCACRSSAGIGPLARVLDFVATAAPGREGDPHDRQDRVGGARGDRGARRLRPRRRRRGRDRSHRRASSARPTRSSELVDVGPLRSQTEWMVRAARRSRAHRGQRRHHARGDAGRRRRSSSSPRLRAEVDVPLGAVIVNRVLPELFTHADEETFDALRDAGAAPSCSTERGRAGRDRGARRGPARGLAAAHAAPRTSTQLRDDGRPAAALRAVPVRARRTACG